MREGGEREKSGVGVEWGWDASEIGVRCEGDLG